MLSAFFSLLPTVLFTFACTAGFIVCLLRPERGRWRELAMAGFGALTLSAVIGMIPQIILLTARYGPSTAALFTVINLVNLLFSSTGIGLLVAAVVSGRSGVGGSSTSPLPDTMAASAHTDHTDPSSLAVPPPGDGTQPR